MHLLAGGDAENIRLFLLQHAAKLIVGGNLVPPAVLKCLAGVGAQVEDGNDFGVGHGIEGRGEVVVGPAFCRACDGSRRWQRGTSGPFSVLLCGQLRGWYGTVFFL